MTNNADKSNEHIQAAIIIDNPNEPEPPQPNQITSSIVLTEEEHFALQMNDDETIDKCFTDADRQAKRTFKRPFLWFAIAVVGLGIAELVDFSYQVVTGSDWLGGLWLIVLATAAVLAVKQLFGQWRSLKQLKQAERFTEQGKAMLGGNSIGLGEDFCLQLAAPLMPLYSKEITQWQASIEPHHLDAEILQLFETHVLQVADQKALGLVTRHASASSAMIAVSPFALLDMAIVLWRNLLMLNQISQVYGLQLNYWGRIKLIKQIFNNMLYAGAAEILTDAGNYALGAGVTGKLSTRLAQGLGAGVLTSRIGLKTIKACRPLPFHATKMPGLSKLSQKLLSDLKKSIS